MLYILAILLWFIASLTVVTANKDVINSAKKKEDKNFLLGLFIVFAPAFLLVEGLDYIISAIVPDDDIWTGGGGRIT